MRFRRIGFVAQIFDRGLQLALGKRVGDKFVCALAQQLVQGARAHVFGDQDHLDLACFCLRDDLTQKNEVFLVCLVHGHCYKLKRFRIRLCKEREGIVKTQITPVFADCSFHIFDK